MSVKSRNYLHLSLSGTQRTCLSWRSLVRTMCNLGPLKWSCLRKCGRNVSRQRGDVDLISLYVSRSGEGKGWCFHTSDSQLWNMNSHDGQISCKISFSKPLIRKLLQIFWNRHSQNCFFYHNEAIFCIIRAVKFFWKSSWCNLSIDIFTTFCKCCSQQYFERFIDLLRRTIVR